MFDALVSTIAHKAFEVAITVTRDGGDPVAARAVLHLDAEAWVVDGGVAVPTREDSISVRHDVDLERGDVVTCADSRAVTTSRTWVVTEREPAGDDGLIKTWRMRETT